MDALARWRILRLHVEDDIPLSALARETGVGLRTLQRWNHQYAAAGIDALTRTLASEWAYRQVFTSNDERTGA